MKEKTKKFQNILKIKKYNKNIQKIEKSLSEIEKSLSEIDELNEKYLEIMINSLN